MKNASLLIEESVFLLFLSILSSAGYIRANPVVAPIVLENPFISIISLTVFFLIGTSVEYVFFKNYVNKFSTNIKERNKMLSHSIIKINLITYPIAQILAYMIYLLFIEYFLIFILFLELGIIIIEWRLLKLELDRIFDLMLPSTQVLSRFAIANLFSFLIGLLGFLF